MKEDNSYIEHLNYQLTREYGKEELAQNQPRFRIVFSDDEIEKRIMTHTNEGFELLYPEVREVPKYRHYIQGRYILERLIPVVGETDLVTKVSYEPVHVFQTSERRGHTYLPPRFDMCYVFIESLLMAAGRPSNFAKYKDPKATPEEYAKQIEDMQKELFGNETDVGDALAHDFGVINQAESKHFEEETTSVVQTEKGE